MRERWRERVGRAGGRGPEERPPGYGGARLSGCPAHHQWTTTTGGGGGGCTRGHLGPRRAVCRLVRDQPRASPIGGRARPGEATPGRAPRPRVGGSGDGVVARYRRPRHSVGSQPGHWRSDRLAPRDALVCRAYRCQAIGVVGPVRPRHHEREAREVADRRVPQIGPGPGGWGKETCPCPSGTARPRYGYGVRPVAMRTPLADGLPDRGPTLRGVAWPRAREVDGGERCAGGLERSRQRAVRDVRIQDYRNLARWQRYQAAEHSRELLVRKQPHRGRAQPAAVRRRMRKPFVGCAHPARVHPDGQPGPHLAAEELPQGAAPEIPSGRIPGVAAAPAALPGGMRGAAAFLGEPPLRPSASVHYGRTDTFWS